MLAELGYLDPQSAGETAGEIAEATQVTEEAVAGETPPTVEPTQGAPETRDEAPEPAPVPGQTASIADQMLVAACDVLVYRALEKAGSRLRSAAGKNVQGGAAAIPCPDPTRLHCEIDATQYADLSYLLEGAWNLAPAIADRSGMPSDALIETLDAYARALLASGQEHDYERLSDALGLRATV